MRITEKPIKIADSNLLTTSPTKSPSTWCDFSTLLLSALKAKESFLCFPLILRRRVKNVCQNSCGEWRDSQPGTRKKKIERKGIEIVLKARLMEWKIYRTGEREEQKENSFNGFAAIFSSSTATKALQSSTFFWQQKRESLKKHFELFASARVWNFNNSNLVHANCE